MNFEGFEARKRDHLRLALEARNEAMGGSGLEQIRLRHRALPELNLGEISLHCDYFGHKAAAPCFISSMTAGHKDGEALNRVLASVASERAWPMGLGSQRRELEDPSSLAESRRLRQSFPKAILFSNLGLAQVIHAPMAAIQKIVESLEAAALIVHLNPLQEALQPEGTPNFAGGAEAIARLTRSLPCPVIVKETGCGFSREDFALLTESGVAVIDVSGFGGTHWGRIEGDRAVDSAYVDAAKTFAFWGESTVDSLSTAREWKRATQSKIAIWASGGIRSGLDAAKCIALGADRVGFAKPALAAAVKGESALADWMTQIELELRMALFCTGSATLSMLQRGDKWQKI